MNPIINPLWFYLIDVVAEIEFVATLVLVIGAVIFIFMGVVYVMDSKVYNEEEKRSPKKFFKSLLVAIIISCIVGSVIPSKETIYAMMAAEQITPNNIQAVGNTTKDAIDYIFEKIEELDKEEQS